MKTLDKIKEQLLKKWSVWEETQWEDTEWGEILIQRRFLTFEVFIHKLSVTGLTCGAEKGNPVEWNTLLTFFYLENQQTEVKQSKSEGT